MQCRLQRQSRRHRQVLFAPIVLFPEREPPSERASERSVGRSANAVNATVELSGRGRRSLAPSERASEVARRLSRSVHALFLFPFGSSLPPSLPPCPLSLSLSRRRGPRGIPPKQPRGRRWNGGRKEGRKEGRRAVERARGNKEGRAGGRLLRPRDLRFWQQVGRAVIRRCGGDGGGGGGNNIRAPAVLSATAPTERAPPSLRAGLRVVGGGRVARRWIRSLAAYDFLIPPTRRGVRPEAHAGGRAGGLQEGRQSDAERALQWRGECVRAEQRSLALLPLRAMTLPPSPVPSQLPALSSIHHFLIPHHFSERAANVLRRRRSKDNSDSRSALLCNEISPSPWPSPASMLSGCLYVGPSFLVRWMALVALASLLMEAIRKKPDLRLSRCRQ